MYSKGDLWRCVFLTVCLLMAMFGVWVALPILINIIVTLCLGVMFVTGVLLCHDIARILDGEKPTFLDWL